MSQSLPGETGQGVTGAPEPPAEPAGAIPAAAIESGAPAPTAPAEHPAAPRWAGKRYTGAAVHVTFDGPRCIHAAECVRGLPAVFERNRRPWILPDGAPAAEVAAVIERCPTGALHYERLDGGPAEAPDATNTIRVRADGPYYVRGRLRVVTADGALVAEDVRLALCRCGHSQHKPFCDNAHIAAGFRDPGYVKPNEGTANDVAVNGVGAAPEPGELSIKTRKHGPLRLEGPFEVIGLDAESGGEAIHRAEETVLCRCGGSATKPFCDGSHKRNGFQAE
jgi:CDGSH-type Zn-finger protein/uncharacterized Fe-S cluster protein YjdI